MEGYRSTLRLFDVFYLADKAFNKIALHRVLTRNLLFFQVLFTRGNQRLYIIRPQGFTKSTAVILLISYYHVMR